MYEEGKKRLMKIHLIIAIPVSIVACLVFTSATGSPGVGILAAIMTFPLALVLYWVNLVWAMSILESENTEEQ